MPLLNFEHRFAAKIESGEKRQTIRTVRKYPIKTGDKLYLYTGARTKNCRRLTTPRQFSIPFVFCKSVERIEIWNAGLSVRIDGMELTNMEVLRLAEADGFKTKSISKTVLNFFEFFRQSYGEYFKGVLIKW
jgi:hypothetical protein